MKEKIAAIILAAGKGVRMKSELPKVLHLVCGRPMVGFVVDVVKALKIENFVVVLGHKALEVQDFLGKEVDTVIQKNQLGTADAVKQGLVALKGFKGTVVVLTGDTPLLTKETLNKLVKQHIKSNASATMLTAKMDKPSGYGRILRDDGENICGTVEEKDATDFQKEIKEINTGIICFNKEKLEKIILEVKPNNKKKEYYLTDVIGLLYKKDELVEGVDIEDINEALGVNSRVELAQANKIMQKRINVEQMKNGVGIIDPDLTFIAYGAKIGVDTTIYPFTVIEKNVTIGKQCSIGPFARIRKGSTLADNVIIGNFIEVSRSQVGFKSVAKHFGFLGDARIGSYVNIGAGTVTANYDGKNKSITQIKDRAFIGSDTVLVAPIKIGKSARTGAGSIVLKNRDVADNMVVAGLPAKPLNFNKGK